MKRTKYRGIYVRELQGGVRSYYLRCTIGGKRTIRWAGHTLTEAKDFRTQYRHLKRFEGLGVSTHSRIRLPALLDLYLEDYRKRRGGTDNLSRIRSTLHKIEASFGNIFVDTLTALEIDRAALPRPDINYLRAILRKAKRWGYINDVPDFHLPPEPKHIKRVLTLTELKAAISQASPDHRDAIWLSISLGGARLGELCKITQENTDFDNRTITLVDRKAGQPKVFALIDTAASILRRRFIANGGVAFRDTSRKLSQRFVYERQKMKGIKPWRFHDLRHTGATILRDSGTPETLVKEILGHASITTTENYIHSTLPQERTALEALERKLRTGGVYKGYTGNSPKP